MLIIEVYFVIALISMGIGLFGATYKETPWWGRLYFAGMFFVGFAVAVILYEKCRFGC